MKYEIFIRAFLKKYFILHLNIVFLDIGFIRGMNNWTTKLINQVVISKVS